VETGDAFADDMHIRRPEPLIPCFGVSGGGEVVDERVEPDVDGLLRVAGKRDAPVEPLPGDRDILETTLQQPQHLVAPDLRIDREFAGPNQLEQRLRVAAQAKEPVALPGGHQVERRMLDAVAVHDLGVGLEFLAPVAVQPLVLTLVEIVG
jgi:hypothetical protein